MDSDEIRRRSLSDQASATLGDMLPPLWRRLYTNCIEEGFTPEEALYMVRTYIVACSASCIRFGSID